MVKYNGRQYKVYKDNYKPVEFWDGGKKVFGPKLESKSHAQVITASDTYNDKLTALEVLAKSTVTGTPAPNETFTNLISNGDFVSLTGWSGGGCTLSIANNVMSLTGGGSSLSPNASYLTNVASAIDKKIALKLQARVTNANCTKLEFYTYNGTTIKYLKTLNNPVQNQWYSTELTSIVTQTDVGTANLRIYVRHYYADSATANGKVMEVKEAMAFDLTALGLSYLTATDINTKVPIYFNGSYTVNNSINPYIPNYNLYVSGKNWFGGTFPNVNFYTNVTGGLSVQANRKTTGFLRVCPNITYTLKIQESGYGLDRVNFYSTSNASGFVQTNSASTLQQYTFTTTANTNYIQFTVRTGDNVTVQLEQGATASAYESFKGLQVIPIGSGMSIGAINDRFYLNLSKLWYQPRFKELVFNGTESWVIYSVTNATGVSYGFFLPLADNPLQDLVSTNFALCNIGVQRQRNLVSTSDLAGIYLGNGNNLYFKIPQSKLADANASTFKAYLASEYASGRPIKIQYQLATPPQPTDLGALEIPTFYPQTVLTLSEPSNGMTVSLRVTDMQ